MALTIRIKHTFIFFTKERFQRGLFNVIMGLHEK